MIWQRIGAQQGKTKHIDVRFQYLREMNEQGMMQIKFVKSEWNVSDICTKNLSENIFQQHAETLGVIPRDREGVNRREGVVSRVIDLRERNNMGP